MNVIRNGTTLQIYDNLTSVGTATITSSSITTDTRNLGREGRWVQDNYTAASNEYLAATFDELRASTTARSIDWITTDYNSQSSPGTFITYTTGSAGELATGGATTTEAAIVSLQATDNCPGTLIAWQTGYEVGVLGFNVYRQLGGQRVQLNTDLVPAMGITRPGGYAYQFVDATSADPARTYWVEEVRFSLDSDLYGPVAPVPGPACDANAVLTGAPNGSPTPVADATSPAEAGGAGGCALGGGPPTSPLVILAAMVSLLSARRRREK